MRQALSANPERPDDPAQRHFERLIGAAKQRVPADLGKLARADLASLVRVATWLEPVLDDVGSIADAARRALARADVLVPMERLSGEVFLGREEELDRLQRFVEEGPGGTILMVSGPGGIGKSALLSRSLLGFARPQGGRQPLPVAYLDLDRVMPNVAMPTFLLAEAADQLSRQLHEPNAFAEIRDDLGLQLRRSDGFEHSKRGLDPIYAAGEFGRAATALDTVVVLVVDTFEEAQYLGPEIVLTLWHLLEEVARGAPNVRVVVAGRVEPENATFEPLPILGLPDAPSRQLVRDALASVEGDSSTPSSFIDAVVELADGNPLTLRLAARIVKEEGVEGLRTAEGRADLLGRIAAEGLQARLYGRVLNHIHDPRVRALAHPGLLVRRIDAGVVREVLAEPCEITLAAPTEASALISALADEIALVERDPSDGSLRHRQDVRRIMLKDLGQVVPPKVARAIHDRAVDHYETQDGPIARAEELYHRLMRGDSARELDARWSDDAAANLRNALDDLPDTGRLWLSKRLGVTPTSDLLARANLADQEMFVVLQAERFLSGGEPEQALEALRELDGRTATSPLIRVESETLRGLGRLDEAKALLLDALPASRASGDAAHLRDLLLQLSQVYEAQGCLEDALSVAREGLDRAAHVGEPAGHLRALVLVLRLLRKLGERHDDERRDLIDEATKLAGSVALRRHPALLRELAAEVGHVKREVLDTALDTIGVEVESGAAAAVLADELSKWDDRLRSKPDRLSELAQRAGLTEGSPNEWAEYLRANLPKIGRDVRSWRANLPSDSSFDKAIVQTYRTVVDASLKGSIR